MPDTAEAPTCPDHRRCPGCGRELSAERSDELCPYCLLAVDAGWESDFGGTLQSGARSFDLPEPQQLQPSFPSLRIESLIGFGGMGAVYRARQESLGRYVALKVLPPEIAASPGFTDRFLREAQALARLSHPNVVTVFEHGTSGPYAYLLMELVQGVNLRELMAGERLQPAEALRIVSQLCDALQFAHEHGVIHRDIKPENILLDECGSVKITDFGIAKLASVEDGGWKTRTRQVMGTWHYMAPEQIERPKEVDHRADLYSLGVVFYELLTGELPLGRFPPPSVKARTDRHIDRVVLRSLEKEPALRYASAQAVRNDLEHRGFDSASERFASTAHRVGQGFSQVESRVRQSVAERHQSLVEFGATLLCVVFYVCVLAALLVIGDTQEDELPAVVIGLTAATLFAAWVLTQVLETAPLPKRLSWLAVPIDKIASFPALIVGWISKEFGNLEGWRAGLLGTGITASLLAVFLAFYGLLIARSDDSFFFSALCFIGAVVAIRSALPVSYQPRTAVQKWLVYPPLMMIAIPAVAVGLLWPVAIWSAALSEPDFARWWYGVVLPPNPAASLRLQAMVGSYAVLESGWLLVVSLIVAVWPGAAVWCVRPLLDRWDGQGRWVLVFVCGVFFVLALFTFFG